jgi:hypothetical protein
VIERYEPASEFLKALVDDGVPLSGSALAEANLRKLMVLTKDPDVSNRDWATMLLASSDIDTEEVRGVLLDAAQDEVEVVRAEALVGIARRDRAQAVPLALRALSGEYASMPVFEAAALIADPVLADAILPWTEPSGDEWLDRLAREALVACRK